jgi:DNA repair photolyase
VDVVADLDERLRGKCELRFHISIESDCDRLPGFPAPASSVVRRFEAAATLRRVGFRVVITVSPLLPIAEPKPSSSVLQKLRMPW